MIDHKTEAQLAEQHGVEVLGLARDLEITTGDDLELAGAALQEIVADRKRYEERLKEITSPIRAAEKSARDLFRPVLTALGAAEAALRGKVARHHDEHNRRRAAELKAAAVTRDTAAMAVAAAPPPKVEGITTRPVWRWEITDEKAIPAEYRCPDTVLIDAIVRRKKGAVEIPGVRVWCETGLNVSKPK